MRESIWPAVFLAAIAGFVDAFGYLALGHLFTAHMSGNAAATGAHLGTARWGEAWHRFSPVPAFVTGVVVGAFTVDLAARRGAYIRLAPAFLVEIGLLAIFWGLSPPSASVPFGHPRYLVLVWLLAAAMGVQAASLTRSGGRRVRTAFISGMLSNFAEELVAWALHLRAEPGAAAPRLMAAVMYGAIVTAFLGGALVGSFGQSHWGRSALAVPIACLGIVFLADILRPRRKPDARASP